MRYHAKIGGSLAENKDWKIWIGTFIKKKLNLRTERGKRPHVYKKSAYPGPDGGCLCNRPYRRLCRSFGADLAVSELYL